jgi:hypothetical protein
MIMQASFSKIFYAHIRAQDLSVGFRFAEQTGYFKTVYVEMVIKIRRQKIEKNRFCVLGRNVKREFIFTSMHYNVKTSFQK